MSMQSRVNKLEEKAGVKKGILVFWCIHPDDWEGELGPGCYRASESENAPRPPNTKVLFRLNFGFCLRTREPFNMRPRYHDDE